VSDTSSFRIPEKRRTDDEEDLRKNHVGQ